TALPRDKVWGGEELRVIPPLDPRTVANEPEPIPLKEVYEDDVLAVIGKPAGPVVHAGSGDWHRGMLDAFLGAAPALGGLPRSGIVHRLDKDTSGLLVVAKTLEAHTALVRQLQARTVRREYAALVHGRLERGDTVEAPIGRHPRQRTRMAVVA